jgi:hypothetical protein
MNWSAPYRWSIAQRGELLHPQFVFRTRAMAEAWAEHCFWCFCNDSLRAVPVPFVQKEPA